MKNFFKGKGDGKMQKKKKEEKCIECGRKLAKTNDGSKCFFHSFVMDLYVKPSSGVGERRRTRTETRRGFVQNFL